MFDHRWMFDHDAFDHGMIFDHFSRPQDSTDGTTFADVPSTRLSYAKYISASPFAVTLGPSSPRPAPLPHTFAQAPVAPRPTPVTSTHTPSPPTALVPAPSRRQNLAAAAAAAGPEECTRAGGRFGCRVGGAGRAQGVGGRGEAAIV
jgi:hypothetical protein